MSNTQDQKVGLYVHIPFCRSKCRYCNFYSQKIEQYDTAKFINALLDELSGYNIAGKVATVYIGGGTPTSLPADQLIRLVEGIIHYIGPCDEFTVEANPSQLDYSLLQYLRRAGLNRLSIGAQSFSRKELEFLGRTHSAREVESAVYYARKNGIENVALDLIYALPGQQIESFEQSLNSAIELNVDHISTYSLTVEHGTPLYKLIRSGYVIMPDEETDRQMYDKAIEMLAAAGYGQYEISNFSLPGMECRHNLAYWANTPTVGIGPSAATWYDNRRSSNISDIEVYIKAIEQGQFAYDYTHDPDEIEIACETAVLNLRRTRGVDLVEYEKFTGFDFKKTFARHLVSHLEDGFLEESDGRIYLSKKAVPIADLILCDYSML